MAAKFHLVQSQTPLTEGRDQTTMCGKNLENPMFGAFCDGEALVNFDLSSLINFYTCRKCADQKWNERYLYAVKERP